MDEKLLFCVSVRTGDQMMYEAEWRETERGRTLIDLFVEVCGNNVLGRQVQVLVSKDRSFLEAAVVQVCTPLQHLADKTQSYIQYILKENNAANKKISPVRSAAKVAAERDTMVNTSRLGSNTSPSKHNMQSHDIEHWKDFYSSKTFHIDHDFSEENGTSDILRKKEAWIHTSTPNQTLKTSFVNMTVEEICNEIKKMKAKEPLKNTLSSWVEDNNKKRELDTKYKDEGNLRHNSSVDQSPRKTSTSSKVTPKCSKPIKNESATNPSANSSLENINKTPTKPVKQPIKKAVSSPRTPSIDRLSVLAQPRRRHSSPVKPNITNKPNTIRKSLTKERINKVKRSPPVISKNTTIKNTTTKKNLNTVKSSTLNKNLNTSTHTTQQSTQQTNLNSTFVQSEPTPCSSKTMKSKKLASSEYFVEIFTKDVDKKKTTEGRVANKEKNINKKADEKPQNNTKNSTSSSKDSQKQIDSNISSKNVSDKPVAKESTIKNDSVTNAIMEGRQSDFVNDIATSTFSMLEFDDILNAVKSQMKTDIRNTENDEEDKNSFDSLIEEDFKTFPMNFSLDFSSEEEDEDIVFIKSPQKDHSKVKAQLDDSFKIEHQDDCFMKLPSKSSAIKIELEERSRTDNCNEQLTLDHVNNSIQTKVHSANVQNDIWLNSRGIKFLGKHNATEQKINDDEAKQIVASGEMNKKNENDNLITEIDSGVEQINDDLEKHLIDAAEQENILDKHRKHWGNKIEGMDSMLVASLQAFSLDLRTSTESLASNIRIVYEDWRSKYENETDVPLESMDNGNLLSSRKSSPKLNDDVSQQQGMAIIFRNLRKAEVHLKTMEQAALTMVKVLHENNDETKDETEESTTKLGLQRTKSFKWNDLKTAAKNQTRPQKWLNHKLTTECSSDSDG